MKDLTWYAVQKDILDKAMKKVLIEDEGNTVTYYRPRTKGFVIPKPPEDELYLCAYGSMIMEGYTIVPSPDGTVYLCSSRCGRSAPYSVTLNTCTCAGYTYSKGGAPCKHMLMLQGYEVYRLRAMALRKTALSPITTGDTQ